MNFDKIIIVIIIIIIIIIIITNKSEQPLLHTFYTRNGFISDICYFLNTFLFNYNKTTIKIPTSELCNADVHFQLLTSLIEK